MSQQSSSQAQDLNRRILERIAADPQFRQQMIANPEQTFANSEYGQEVEQLASQRQSGPLQSHGAISQQMDCTWTCTYTRIIDA